ncbi:MAG: glycosyltransferase family 39 protein [candidate division Zixibacteria bacterium]|nr:glycosyltransferase family 39 protein [candidate division Zixibacteria bacterium]
MSSSLTDKCRTNWGLLLVLALACLIRVYYLLEYQSLPDWDMLTVDNNYHHHWALSIAGGDILGDTTYFRAPFYVFCLSFLYWLFGASLWVGRIFGMTLGLGSIVVTCLLTRPLFGRKVALVAAVLQAVNPVMIYFEGELLLDPLFMLLLQLAVYRLVHWLDGHRPSDAFWTGLFLALASITRPTALMFIVIIPLSVLLFKRPEKRLAVQFMSFLLPLVVIVGAVFVRNLAVAGDPVIVASQGGINFYIGNNPDADGLSAALPEPLGHNWKVQDISYVAQKETGEKLLPGQVSAFWTSRAMEWIAGQPGQFLSLYGKKLYHNFSNREISNNRSLAAFFAKMPILKYSPVTFGLLLSLAVVGLMAGWRSRFETKLLLLLMAAYLAASSLFFFNSRFRLPLLPFYVTLAANGLWFLARAVATRPRAVITPALIGAVTAVFSFYPVIPLPEGQITMRLMTEGLYAYTEGRYGQALSDFRSALAAEPSFPEINLNVGACHFRLGHQDSAYYYFNREKQLHPGRHKAYTNIASLLLLNGRYREAVAEVSLALQRRPYDIQSHMIRLRAAAAQPEITGDSLLGLVFDAVDKAGNDIFLLDDAAALFSQRGDQARAESVLLIARNAAPPPIETDDAAFERHFRNSRENWKKERAKTFYQLGYIAGLDGRFDESLDFSRRAIDGDPDLVGAYVNLASGFMSTGRFSEADSILTIATEKFPDDEQIRWMLNSLDR